MDHFLYPVTLACILLLCLFALVQLLGQFTASVYMVYCFLSLSLPLSLSIVYTCYSLWSFLFLPLHNMVLFWAAINHSVSLFRSSLHSQVQIILCAMSFVCLLKVSIYLFPSHFLFSQFNNSCYLGISIGEILLPLNNKFKNNYMQQQHIFLPEQTK